MCTYIYTERNREENGKANVVVCVREKNFKFQSLYLNEKYNIWKKVEF